MSIEVRPGLSAPIRVCDSYSYDMDLRRISELLKNLIPLHEEIIIRNQTKTCKVTVSFVEKAIYIVVTNEKEDSQFKLEIDESPENS